MNFESSSEGAIFHSKGLSKSSIIKFFVVGSILLVSPIVLAAFWQTTSCNHEFEDLCLGSQFYKSSISFLPYVMIIGGLIIGFNMKRISDSIIANEKEDSDTDESNDGSG